MRCGCEFSSGKVVLLTCSNWVRAASLVQRISRVVVRLEADQKQL
jgi:hypothetical protein